MPNVMIVTAQSASQLTDMLEDLEARGLEFSRHDILSLVGKDDVFMLLGTDAETAKKISSIVNYVPD